MVCGSPSKIQKHMNKHTNAIIFGIAIIASALVLGNAFMNRNKTAGTISVTGLGKADFDSDLIVWEGHFEALNTDLKQAYLTLENNKRIVQTYLEGKGIKSSEIVFSAVRTNEEYKRQYTANGDYIGDLFVGYKLTQNIQIESKEVDKIEKVSREITELLNQGVPFYSSTPRYYYTQLADLKIEMISKATEDARVRAEKISENSGSDLGILQTAKMGVFQITGQNSGEDYSWGGTFNTTSRAKTASITMKLVYEVD